MTFKTMKTTDYDLIINVLRAGGKFNHLEIQNHYQRQAWGFWKRISEINAGKVKKYAGTKIKSEPASNKLSNYWLERLFIDGKEMLKG